MKRVLIAIHPEPVSYAAARHYLEKMRQPTDYVYFFHLFTPPTIPRPGGPALCDSTPEQLQANSDYERMEIGLEKAIKELQNEFEIPDNLFQYTQLDTTNHSQNAENIAKEILMEIKDKKMDLVVMGSRNTCTKIFLGSVSDMVAKKANVMNFDIKILKEKDMID